MVHRGSTPMRATPAVVSCCRNPARKSSPAVPRRVRQALPGRRAGLDRLGDDRTVPELDRLLVRTDLADQAQPDNR